MAATSAYGDRGSHAVKSVNTFLCSCGRRVGLSGYRAAGSTCGISPSRSLQDSRTAAGRASHTPTRSTPAEGEEKGASWRECTFGFVPIFQGAKWKQGNAKDKAKNEGSGFGSRVVTSFFCYRPRLKCSDFIFESWLLLCPCYIYFFHTVRSMRSNCYFILIILSN